MQPIEFLKRVWSWNVKPGQYVFISTKDGSRWRDHAIKYPDWKRVKELINANHEHTYFCPNPFSAPRRHLSVAAPARMLWSDVDSGDVKRGPDASVLWRTSPGRYSALWHLERRYAPEELTKHNKNLTYLIGADKGGWDFTQVLRIPGTKNRKYKEQPEVKLLRFEESPIPVPRPLLDKYKDVIPLNVKQVLLAKVADGDRSGKLFYLEHALSKAGVPLEDMIAIVSDTVWNKFTNRPEQLRAECEDVWNKYAPKKAKAKSVDEDEDDEDASDDESLSIVCAADVEPKSVSYLWYPYIPKGKLTLIEGDPSAGKSWITLSLAAHITKRRRLPGQIQPPRGSRRVLFMAPEDGIDDTQVPRAITMGADRRHLFFAKHAGLTLDEKGVELVRQQIRILNPALIVIDPLVAFMAGGLDIHKANAVRQFTTRIAELAESYGVAIIGVRHLTKGGRDKALYRGIGSIDFTAAARSVLHVGESAQDEGVRVMVHVKSSTAPLGRAITYELARDRTPPFRWTGFSDVKADDLANSDKDLKKAAKTQSDAKKLIAQILSKGPVPSTTVFEQAEGRSISRRTLLRARDELEGVTTFKENGVWKWKMESSA